MRGLFALGMFLGTLKDWISSPFALKQGHSLLLWLELRRLSPQE